MWGITSVESTASQSSRGPDADLALQSRMNAFPPEPCMCTATCMYTEWAVTGSNRRPLRCKRQ